MKMNKQEKKRKEIDITQIITFVVIAFSVIGIIWLALSYQSQSENYIAKYNENETTLAKLKNQYESGVQETTDTEETATTKLNSAVTKGNEVAKLQNKYYEIYKNQCLNVYEVDEKAYSEAIKSNAASLEPCFAEADTSGSAVWYLSETSDVIWSFRTTFSFTGDTVPSLWTCYNTSGELLAFTTADYDVESDTFNNVKCYITSIGQSYSGNDSNEPEKTQKPKATKKPKPKATKKPVSSNIYSGGSSSSSGGSSSSSSGSSSKKSGSSGSSKKSTKKQNTKKKNSDSDSDWNTDDQYTQWEG